jgi:hypothetical protein
MCNKIFKNQLQNELTDEAAHVMNQFNISLKDIQNKPFEKFLAENLAEVQKSSPRGLDAPKEIIKVRFNHF